MTCLSPPRPHGLATVPRPHRAFADPQGFAHALPSTKCALPYFILVQRDSIPSAQHPLVPLLRIAPGLPWRQSLPTLCSRCVHGTDLSPSFPIEHMTRARPIRIFFPQSINGWFRNRCDSIWPMGALPDMIFGTLRTKICSFLRAPKLVGYKPRFLRDFFFFFPPLSLTQPVWEGSQHRRKQIPEAGPSSPKESFEYLDPSMPETIFLNSKKIFFMSQ